MFKISNKSDILQQDRFISHLKQKKSKSIPILHYLTFCEIYQLRLAKIRHSKPALAPSDCKSLKSNVFQKSESE